MLYLDSVRNGHIVPTKSSLFSSDCIPSSPTSVLCTTPCRVVLDASTFSSGNLQAWLIESKPTLVLFYLVFVFEKNLSVVFADFCELNVQFFAYIYICRLSRTFVPRSSPWCRYGPIVHSLHTMCPGIPLSATGSLPTVLPRMSQCTSAVRLTNTLLDYEVSVLYLESSQP
jgi:hypothetical protein